MNERRRFLRFDTAIDAHCEVSAEKAKTASKVKNISKEGALLLVTKPLAQGAEIRLSMDVPGDNVPIFASCEVAWQNGRETGVRFVKMERTDKGRLLEYIYTQWLKLIDHK